LLGLPQSSSVRFGDSNTYFRGAVYNTYVSDDWRVRSNLTLNFGVRYEYFTPYTEKYGRIANLDIAPNFTGVAVVTPGGAGPYTGRFPDGLIDAAKNNWSPRVGIAWRPFKQRQLLIRTGYGIFYNGSIYSQFASRLASQPPFANTATLNTSLAAVLTLENGFPAAPSTQITNTYAVARNYQPGYAQTWNFSIQQELPHAIIVELGYLGTKGTHLDIQRLPNRAAPGSPLTAEQRRQIGNAVGFLYDSSEGNSIYNALQARMIRRFRGGISMNALYTYSKSIDNASTFGGAGALVAQNDKDLAAERGLSSFDQRHRLNLNFVLSSPVGPNARFLRGGGTAAKLLQDWTLSGGITAASGTPLTARVLGNQADTGGTGSFGSGRAEATGEPVNADGGYFNLAAFTLPPPGQFGNAGRNTIPGPSQYSLNLAIGRTIQLGAETRRRLELRLESQNVTNHVNITNLGTVVNASNYGLPTAAGSMRSLNAVMRFRF
ncbi:MAG TPA: TonB-dependent receptor, partial [Bryobacterales bacterium]|nr:TonB-dependent receptor [Bryobacterales bacterium]